MELGNCQSKQIISFKGKAKFAPARNEVPHPKKYDVLN
jgi:hypothetical protein